MNEWGGGSEPEGEDGRRAWKRKEEKRKRVEEGTMGERGEEEGGKGREEK